MPGHKKKRTHHAGKGLHPRNQHNAGYDFAVLTAAHPALEEHVKSNKYGKPTIDFADPVAVKVLNAALLHHHYGIAEWDIPEGFLCPPIPGRVDYVHHVADLLERGARSDCGFVRLLDIGTGANGIYSILACQAYDWCCVASDIDPLSIENVSAIVSRNPVLEGRLEPRLQLDKGKIFGGIIREGEYYDVSVCNPPFHASLEEALKGTQKKLENLSRSSRKGVLRGEPVVLNFGGQKAELWCAGGEIRFLKRMIKESKEFADQCQWFTSLISKGENVQPSIKLLRKLEATEIKEIEMQQGNKITRILAWTFVHS